LAKLGLRGACDEITVELDDVGANLPDAVDVGKALPKIIHGNQAGEVAIEAHRFRRAASLSDFAFPPPR